MDLKYKAGDLVVCMALPSAPQTHAVKHAAAYSNSQNLISQVFKIIGAKSNDSDHYDYYGTSNSTIGLVLTELARTTTFNYAAIDEKYVGQKITGIYEKHILRPASKRCSNCKQLN